MDRVTLHVSLPSKHEGEVADDDSRGAGDVGYHDGEDEEPGGLTAIEERGGELLQTLIGRTFTVESSRFCSSTFEPLPW